MRTRRYAAILIVGILLLAAAAQAASVRGQLLFSNNSPAAFVAVRLNSASRGPSEFAYSGTDGKFYLNNVPVGTYQLEVWRGKTMVLRIGVSVQEPVSNIQPTRLP